MRIEPLLTTITLVVITLFSTSVRSQCALTTENLGEDAMTILRLTLGNRGLTLHEGVMAYSTAEGVFLPIGEFSRALDFPITVDSTGRQATGWFLQPERRFNLALADCSVTISDRRYDLEAGKIIVDIDDIYVATDILQTWFPLQIQVDTSRLLVKIHSTERLPVEQRLERQENWRGVAVTAVDEAASHPVHDVPYRLWDWPFIDLTGEVKARRLNDTSTDWQHRYKLMAAGDLLLMNTEFSAVGDDTDSLRDVFLTMSRYDEAGDLLGPLNAREYALGDMGIFQDQLVTNSVLGRGIRISSFPLHRPAEFHAIDLRGELPLGWEVELYQNDRLVNFHIGGGPGRYDFTAVPLEFGINEFRLVFYGPQGQVREETFRKVIGPGMVTPGEHYFRLTAMEEREMGRIGSPAPTHNRLFAAYEWGITPDMSVGGGFKSLVLDDIRHNYGSVNLNASTAGFFSTLEVSADDKSGHAVAASVFGRLAGVDIRAETARFNDFHSERTLVGGPGELFSRHRLRLNSWLPQWRSLNTSLGLTLSNEQWSQGRRSGAETRISIGNYRWNLTQAFDAYRFREKGLQTEGLNNSVLFSTRFGPVSLRGELDQEILPEQQLHNLGVSMDWRIDPRVHWHIGFNRSPSQGINTFITGLNWQLEHVSLGGNLQTTNERDFIVGLTVSSGLLREPQSGSWRASSLPNIQTAAIATRVFLDQNNNGRRDDEEVMIPASQVRVAGTGAINQSDADGLAFLSGLPVHQSLTVSVVPESLENPFWRAEEAGRRLTLRPGRSAYVELPVVPTGLIEGTVYTDGEADERRALSSVSIQLFSTNSELVQQTYSAYDGYYTFEGLQPGQYRVRISAEGDSDSKVLEEVVAIGGQYAMSKSVDFALLSPEPVTHSIAVMDSPEVDPPLDSQTALFTIQLIGMRDENAVKQFIERNDLQKQAAYITGEYQGQPWYSVLYGQYSDREEARAALAGLSPALRQDSPWIRALRSIRTQTAPPTPAAPTIPPSVEPDAPHLTEAQDVEVAVGRTPIEAWLSAPFTLQIIAMSSETAVQRFIERYDLQDEAVYFETRYQGKPWFPVVYGQFDNREQANSALATLPVRLRQASPWIRSLQSIRADLASLATESSD